MQVLGDEECVESKVDTTGPEAGNCTEDVSTVNFITVVIAAP